MNTKPRLVDPAPQAILISMGLYPGGFVPSPSMKQAKGSTAWPPLFPAASPVPKPSYAACNSTSSSHTAIPCSSGHLPPQAPRRIRAPRHACLSSFIIWQREKSSVTPITHASSSLFPFLYFDFPFSKISGVATCWGLGCPPSLLCYEAASVGLLEGSQHLSKMKVSRLRMSEYSPGALGILALRFVSCM